MHIPEESLLEARFSALWMRCSLNGIEEGAEQAWVDVAKRYTEPHRHYHSLAHIVHTLQQFDLTARFMQQPDAVEMAIWFHDIINEAGAADNEQKSVGLFQRLAAGYLVPEFIERVSALILTTRHQQYPTFGDDSYICDIDLSGFGLPWKQFLKDSDDVRAELAHVPDEDPYAGHHKFLVGLLARPRIYCTKYFYDRYESRARENVQRYMHQIEADGLA